MLLPINFLCRTVVYILYVRAGRLRWTMHACCFLLLGDVADIVSVHYHVTFEHLGQLRKINYFNLSRWDVGWNYCTSCWFPMRSWRSFGIGLVQCLRGRGLLWTDVPDVGGLHDIPRSFHPCHDHLKGALVSKERSCQSALLVSAENRWLLASSMRWMLLCTLLSYIYWKG